MTVRHFKKPVMSGTNLRPSVRDVRAKFDLTPAPVLAAALWFMGVFAFVIVAAVFVSFSFGNVFSTEYPGPAIRFFAVTFASFAAGVAALRESEK